MKPVEGVRSTGSRFVEIVRFGALPQVHVGFASYALLRFEINVRVGFGGRHGGRRRIGQDLFVAIRKFYYTDVSAILLMIIVCVASSISCTERIRQPAVRPGERPMSARRMHAPDDASAVLDRHRGLFDDSPLRRARQRWPRPLGIFGFAIFAVWWLAIPLQPDRAGAGIARQDSSR